MGLSQPRGLVSGGGSCLAAYMTSDLKGSDIPGAESDLK